MALKWVGGCCRLEICSKSAGLQDSQISDGLYSGQAMEGSLGLFVEN